MRESPGMKHGRLLVWASIIQTQCLSLSWAYFSFFGLLITNSFTFSLSKKRERESPSSRSFEYFLFSLLFPTIYLCLEFFSFLKHRTLLSTTCRHYRFYTRNKTLSWLGKLFIKLLHGMTKFQVPNKTWNTFTFHEFIAKFIFTLLYMNDI